MSATKNTFTIHEDGTITRDADGKEVAVYNFDEAKFEYAHNSYTNYADDLHLLIKNHLANPAITSTAQLLDTEEAPGPAEGVPASDLKVPKQKASIPKEQPERCVIAGEYSAAHLLYDAKNMSPEELFAKWGDQYTSGAIRHWMEKQPALFRGHTDGLTEALEKAAKTAA
jgi:hypothetical protein